MLNIEKGCGRRSVRGGSVGVGERRDWLTGRPRIDRVLGGGEGRGCGREEATSSCLIQVTVADGCFEWADEAWKWTGGRVKSEV